MSVQEPDLLPAVVQAPVAAGLEALAVSGVIVLDAPEDVSDDEADLRWLLEHGVLPISLPPKGTAPPAATAHELAALLLTAGAAREVLAATAGWLSSERRSSPATQAGYIKEVSWWLWWVQARGLHLPAVPFLEADLFAAAMRAIGLAPASRNRRRAAISSWYRYLVRAGQATHNPFDGMETAHKQPSTTRYLTQHQLEQLLDHTATHESPRVQAIMAVLVGTACRIGSLLDLRYEHLSHDAGHRTVDLPVKGGWLHRVVIDPFTEQLMQPYLDERGTAPGALFVTSTGKPLQRSYVFALVRRLAAAAQIPHADQLSVHSLRHSVATALLENDEPMDVVQALLGHADPRTTQTYAHANALNRSPAYRWGRRLQAGLTHRQAASGRRSVQGPVAPS